MTPLGLHHIMAAGHHHGPGPWVDGRRPDWTAVYYHRASPEVSGFDRTSSGSNAVEQYHQPVADFYGNIETCPEEFLLWFHRVPWDYKVKSGNTVWDVMAFRYNQGVNDVRNMQKIWNSLEEFVDSERFTYVKALLGIQVKEAVWWCNACLLYFQTFSDKPIPPSVEQPDKSLDYYMGIREIYMPGHH